MSDGRPHGQRLFLSEARRISVVPAVGDEKRAFENRWRHTDQDLRRHGNGRPVVSTAAGAEGLPLERGRHIVIADSPAEFAGQVVGLLEDPGGKEAVAVSGWQFVTEHCGWKNVAQQPHDQCF